MLENNREEERLKKHLTKEMDSIKVPEGLKEEMWTQIKPVRKKRRLNLKIVLPYVATFACIIIIVALGLSGFPFSSEPTPSDNVTNHDKNIQTIEAVLEKALTGPKDEVEKMTEGVGLEDLVQYEEKLYRDYFADDTSYLNFVNSYGSTLMIIPKRNDYNLKVKNIEYEKSESKEIIYDFTVELQYQKQGSESSKVEMITGEANMNEEHKIEGMAIRIDDFLGSLLKK
ncbi:hypothetical protein CFK37_19045 [Virgibacillus phasianinus]|uniref:Uncharacterized protein n=1 Tax=Virgibacillus phasianinus TaxID=2017483 RepID=A0A220U8A9_9BACI|nr:hypothetical protein [Virgibacillus phasianinus]ASK64101.1 hypothetical protein CFK37_19045 [Virgibacillus phasianinus]